MATLSQPARLSLRPGLLPPGTPGCLRQGDSELFRPSRAVSGCLRLRLSTAAQHLSAFPFCPHCLPELEVAWAPSHSLNDWPELLSLPLIPAPTNRAGAASQSMASRPPVTLRFQGSMDHGDRGERRGPGPSRDSTTSITLKLTESPASKASDCQVAQCHFVCSQLQHTLLVSLLPPLTSVSLLSTCTRSYLPRSFLMPFDTNLTGPVGASSTSLWHA
eukprot:3430354-Rhodomonas_salina.1